MKVGLLVRALSLLLALSSVTVLALTGSIDRTLKTGTALLLLASLHSVSSGNPPPTVEKSAVDRCADKSMVCFAPESCKDGGTDHKMIQITTDAITSDCKTILKIRPYSTKMYRVALESRDPEVNEITVTREGPRQGPVFSCKAGSEPQYKGSPIKSIESIGSPLKCEFISKDGDADIFQLTNDNIVTKTDGKPSSILKSEAPESTFSSPISRSKYCNPADAIFDAYNPGGTYSVERVTIGLKDLSCSEHYQLETRLLMKAESQMEPEFVKTTSIECKEETGGQHKFTIVRDEATDIPPFEPSEIFNVRCAVKTCTLCQDLPPGGLTIVDAADGCKELKCSSGRLKVGQSVGDAAICKKINDKATWDLNGTPIEKTTAVACETKKECTNASTLCGTACSVDSTSGLPTCASGQLTFQSKPVTLSCDNTTGKWMYSDGGPGTQLPDGSTLSCAVAGTAGQESVASASTTTILCIVFGVIILIALVVGFVIYFHRLKKQREEQSKKAKTMKSKEKLKKQPGSNESKSVNSNQTKSNESRVPAVPPTPPNQAPPPPNQAPPPSNQVPPPPNQAPPPGGAPSPAAPSPAPLTPAAPPAAELSEDIRLAIQREKEASERREERRREREEREKAIMRNRPAESTGGDTGTGVQGLGDTIQIPSGQRRHRDVDKGKTNNDETVTKGHDKDQFAPNEGEVSPKTEDMFGPELPEVTQITQGTTGTAAGGKKK